MAGFLKTGVKVRTKSRSRERTNASFINGGAYNSAYRRAFPERAFVRQGPPGAPYVLNSDEFDLTGFFDGDFPMPISLDPDGAEELFTRFDSLRIFEVNPGTRDYTADENVYASYLMADLTFANRVTLNAGLRYEYSRQCVYGLRARQLRRDVRRGPADHRRGAPIAQ